MSGSIRWRSSFLLLFGLERVTVMMMMVMMMMMLMINVNVVGISKKSRSLFLELDATAVRTQQQHQPVLSPLPKDDSRRKSREVRKWFLKFLDS
jgi:cytochrome P450